MARWRLVCAHYLKTDPPQYWEYKETDRQTGKQVVRKFEVPTLLNPEDPADWNHRDGFGNGELVVAYAGKTTNSRDIIFIGEPTPDMVPLDEEAEAITKSLQHKWKHPIESLSGTYSEALMKEIDTEMGKVRAATAQQAAAPVTGLTELMAAMATVMKQNAELIQFLAKSPTPPVEEPASIARRA